LDWSVLRGGYSYPAKDSNVYGGGASKTADLIGNL
jgi:hypothetical protein